MNMLIYRMPHKTVCTQGNPVFQKSQIWHERLQCKIVLLSKLRKHLKAIYTGLNKHTSVQPVQKIILNRKPSKYEDCVTVYVKHEQNTILMYLINFLN